MFEQFTSIDVVVNLPRLIVKERRIAVGDYERYAQGGIHEGPTPTGDRFSCFADCAG